MNRLRTREILPYDRLLHSGCEVRFRGFRFPKCLRD